MFVRKYRTFLLVYSEIDAHKLFFQKSKTKHTEYGLKNMQYPWKLLQLPY